MGTTNDIIERTKADRTESARGCIAINYGGGDQTLTQASRGLHINTAGNLNLVFLDDSEGVFTLAAGQHPFQVKKIKQASSTAAGFVLV